MDFITVNTADSVNVITKFTYVLFLFLVLAIFIERSTEIFMSLLKYLDLKLKNYHFWNKRAEKFQEKYDQLLLNGSTNNEDKKFLFKWILWKFVSPEPYTGGKVIIAAKSIRTHYFRIIGRIFAFFLALVFSWLVFVKYELDLFEVLKNVSQTDLFHGALEQNWIKILLTAILLAAGSEPLHAVIKRAEKIGQTKKQEKS